MRTVAIVLSGTYQSGADWIIDNGDSYRDAHTHEWFSVCNTQTMHEVINYCAGSDFVGHILPNFQNNPDSGVIIKLIFKHKLGISAESAAKFMEMVNQNSHLRMAI